MAKIVAAMGKAANIPLNLWPRNVARVVIRTTRITDATMRAIISLLETSTPLFFTSDLGRFERSKKSIDRAAIHANIEFVVILEIIRAIEKYTPHEIAKDTFQLYLVALHAYAKQKVLKAITPSKVECAD